MIPGSVLVVAAFVEFGMVSSTFLARGLWPRFVVSTLSCTRRDVATAATFLVVALGLLTGCTSDGSDPVAKDGAFEFVAPDGGFQFTYPPQDRKTVGEISGPSVQRPDSRVSLSTYAKKVVVLNFWGSWCGSCRGEQDFLNLQQENLAGQGVQFIGINVRDNQEGASSFIASKQVPYPSIFDPTMRVLLSLRGMPASGIPATVILDRDHRVAAIWVGAISNPSGFVSELKSVAAEK